MTCEDAIPMLAPGGFRRPSVGLNFEHRDFILSIGENKSEYTQLKNHTFWYTLNRSE
jgi:hypothetical protein